MCGISGYFHFNNAQHPFPRLDIDSSLKYINHRGPDSNGKYTSPCGRCGLGHTRLSIIDLEGGQQPLSDESGGIQVVVNGEFYDYKRIRQELIEKGYQFKTESDSEIAVFLYKEYGLSFVDHLRGEFAICIYDARKNQLIMVRDRYGVRPLFYTVVGGTLLFASEMKAFLGLGWKAEWDIDSIVQNGTFIDQRTLFKGVYKVPPAHYVTANTSGTITAKPYWDINFPNKYKKETRSVEEMIQGVRERLVESVRQRLVADVPVGVFLSGGLDSSVVAGIAAELLRENNSEAQLKAFSISFTGGGRFDEGTVAERTAQYLNADYEIVGMSEDELLENFPDTIWHCEMPNLNLAPVGRYLVAKRAHEQGYKVVLTGEGSDENFAGYLYFQGDYVLEPDLTIPDGFETLSEEHRLKILQMFGGDSAMFSRYIASDHGPNRPSVARKILNGMIGVNLFGGGIAINPTLFSKEAIQQCGPPDYNLAFAENSIDGLARYKIQNEWHPLHSVMYVETRTILANGLLCSHGDRCDMASSIESRTPFLDHHFTEYVMTLPPSVRIKGDSEGKLNEKWILKEASKPYITEELYKRTKEPYLAPMARGHNDTFARLVEDYLSKESIEKLGWVDVEEVENLKAKYFEEGCVDNRAYQNILLLISYVVMSRRFEVATYEFRYN